jgi:hypothetical protein
VNSFAGVDLGDITGGLINGVEDLSDPDRLLCFMAQAIQADVPSFLDNVFNGVALQRVLALIPTVLVPALKPLMLTCPNLPPGRSVMQYGSNYPGIQAKSSGNRNPYK